MTSPNGPTEAVDASSLEHVGSSQATRTASVVAVTNLDVTLGGQEILRGVTMRVDAGEVVALLGTNGSGKSTLVRATLGVVPHTSGRVELFGHAARRDVPWRRIGYVPQRMPAPTGVPATAVEVVTAGLLYGHRFRPPRRSRAAALDALDVVGMAQHADRPVALLSGGQQQRVLIARALVRDPDLLVLDEPTAGVDVDSQQIFTMAVERRREAGAAVLVVLHELGEFAPLITRAIVLRHGEVVHDGHPPAAHGNHGEPGHDHDHPHDDPTPRGHHISVEVTP